ncbi:hypothetical protein EJB05_32388, partial [Eragrostis curvula]
MASMQKSHDERAQSAAEKAADELAAARQQQQQGQHDDAGGGILGSVQESARSAMDAVRDTLSSGGAAPATAATTGTKGAASDRASQGVMDAARSAAERAREFAAEKKEGARQALAGDAVARKGETNESAWQQGEDVRRRAAEKAQEEQRSAADKGRSAMENIYGKARGAMGAFGEKMVMPTDVVEQKQSEAAGGEGNAGPRGAGATSRAPRT